MPSAYRCQRCAWMNTWMRPAGVEHENLMFRCERCGTPHSLPAGEAIGPRTRPVTSSNGYDRPSPWFSGQYVPTAPGFYDVVFTVSPVPVRLRWSGRGWTWGLARVDTRQLMKWRGLWD